MQVAVYDLIVPQMTLGLTNLKNILTKAQALAEKKNFDVAVLFQTRLAPDMFPLSRQIQICTDVAKGAGARLTGVDAPVFEDKEVTFDEFIARINKTIKFLETISPGHFEGYEKRKASFPWVPGKYLEGKDFLIQHALPNFYFHLTTSYAILRAAGVEIGKGDFLGNQNWKNS